MKNAGISLSLVVALALIPSGLLAQPRGGHRGPPPEAQQACADQEEGTACAFEAPDGVVEGTCRRPPRAEALACVPNDHRPPPDDGRGRAR